MKNLKQRLADNSLTIGSWITLGHDSVAEIMANAGFDWLAVDMEHSAITLSEAQRLIQVIELSGVIPLVRVGENNSLLIKRVMDAGAHGVIVPMVNTREDAARAVRSVKYPPLGTRGVGLARAQGYGMEFERYKEWAEKNTVVIVQIEHAEAMDNIKDILKVEGVDGAIIGPYDLSASMGHPGEFQRKEMVGMLDKFLEACKKFKKPAGFHVVAPDPEDAKKKISQGFNFLAFGVDMLFLATKCRTELSRIRKGKS